ncbi:MAG: hypothetical protein IKO42_05140, partial [Opitutales bacterium]|nr:hypothetical protein [Opitutales bacterium]
TGLSLAATIPFLDYAKGKSNLIPTIVPWIFVLILIFGAPEIHSPNELPVFALSNFLGANVCGKLALIGFYGFIIYAFLKFLKTFFCAESSKAFCLMPTLAFAFVAIVNFCPVEKCANAFALAASAFVFVCAFAFFVSGFLRRNFALLNCGSLLLASWALQKFFNSQANTLSASRTLVCVGLVILAINVIFSKILKNRE